MLIAIIVWKRVAWATRILLGLLRFSNLFLKILPKFFLNQWMLNWWYLRWWLVVCMGIPDIPPAAWQYSCVLLYCSLVAFTACQYSLCTVCGDGSVNMNLSRVMRTDTCVLAQVAVSRYCTPCWYVSWIWKVWKQLVCSAVNVKLESSYPDGRPCV